MPSWGVFVSVQDKPRPGTAPRLARHSAKPRAGTAATIGRCLLRTLLCVVAVPSISDEPLHAPPSVRDLPGLPLALRIPAADTDPPIIDFDLPARNLVSPRRRSCPSAPGQPD
jgi:hypothetical protein